MLPAADLRAFPEFFRPDPFGGIVKPDRPAHSPDAEMQSGSTRRATAMYHCILLLLPDPGTDYSISIQLPLPDEVYREWYHRNAADQQYYPDALIPVRLPYKSRLPEPDNRVSGQTAQSFWLDIWVPGTASGSQKGTVTLTSGRSVVNLPIEITIGRAAVPNDDAVTLDSNAYGTSWMFEQYPTALSRTEERACTGSSMRIIASFYEHRSTFHQLGYGHAGKTGPEFAPELTGSGRSKHISSWAKFDAHYGPLLDGSAFRDAHRGAHPIPWVYLPINPEWPASFLWWGEPGYDVEFVNVVSEMERHFREKGWTSTRFEMFFNHKKRYKGFAWDGDEIRFPEDNNRIADFRKLLDRAVPKNSPVQFVVRADTSWSMADQFERLKGIVNFWVASEGMLAWQPAHVLSELKQRRDTVWTYGGTPAVDRPAVEMTLHPIRTWVNGAQGFVRWQTVDPGPDAWYNLNGGGETLVYPGDRFGVAGPLPSIRLKLQRNALQDIALLQTRAERGGRQTLVAQIVSAYNGSSPEDWRMSPPPLTAKPPLEWNNTDIEDALSPWEARFRNLSPDAWQRSTIPGFADVGGEAVRLRLLIAIADSVRVSCSDAFND